LHPAENEADARAIHKSDSGKIQNEPLRTALEKNGIHPFSDGLSRVMIYLARYLGNQSISA
jgi:hypothetical protein